MDSVSLLPSPSQRGRPLARSGICGTCDGFKPRLRPFAGSVVLECDTCYGYRYANDGQRRPDELIVRAALRRLDDQFTEGIASLQAAVDTSEAMLQKALVSVSVDCSCGCGHPADAGCGGLSKRCADLSWYRHQHDQEQLLTAS